MNSGLKWKLAFAFLLVFVAGASTGAFFGIHLLQHHIMLGPPHSGDVPGRMREHFRRTLGLTEEQEKQITPIIDATSAKLEAIRVETAERVRTVMEESKKEVAPLLTSEQQQKLDKVDAEHREMMMHHGFFPPPPPKDKAPSPPAP
jgi:Spy/CpxP family protein refolding chaperone